MDLKVDSYIAQAEVVQITGRPDAYDLVELVAEHGAAHDLEPPGLLWRRPVERMDPAFLRHGDRLVVDLSVWRSYADVWQSAYAGRSLNAGHARRAPLTSRVLWWVEPGDTPSTEEAVQRLAHLERYGPGPTAFTLRSPAPRPRRLVDRDPHGIRRSTGALPRVMPRPGLPRRLSRNSGISGA